MLLHWGDIGIGRAGHEEQIRQLLINKQRLEAGHRNAYERATNTAAARNKDKENTSKRIKVEEIASSGEFGPTTINQRRAATEAEKAWTEAMAKSAKVSEPMFSSGSR